MTRTLTALSALVLACGTPVVAEYSSDASRAAATAGACAPIDVVLLLNTDAFAARDLVQTAMAAYAGPARYAIVADAEHAPPSFVTPLPSPDLVIGLVDLAHATKALVKLDTAQGGSSGVALDAIADALPPTGPLPLGYDARPVVFVQWEVEPLASGVVGHDRAAIAEALRQDAVTYLAVAATAVLPDYAAFAGDVGGVAVDLGDESAAIAAYVQALSTAARCAR